jgi:hypothetical protein
VQFGGLLQACLLIEVDVWLPSQPVLLESAPVLSMAGPPAVLTPGLGDVGHEEPVRRIEGFSSIADEDVERVAQPYVICSISEDGTVLSSNEAEGPYAVTSCSAGPPGRS